jgi:hypothetical protein
MESPVGATRLSTGIIVVADQDTWKLRFFDATGKLIRAVGQYGQGPGDFERLMWIGQCSTDSIFAWDYRLRRVTVFDGSGKRVREFAFAGKAAASAAPGLLACSRTGRIAIQPDARWAGTSVSSSPNSSVRRARAPVSIVDRLGRVTAELGDPWAGELYSVNGRENLYVFGYRPLGRRTSIAVFGDRTYVGTADSGSVDIYGPDGERTGAIALRLTGRPVSAANIEHSIEAELGTLPPPLRPQVRELVRRAVPAPAQLPAYDGLFTDPTGVLWAVVSTYGDSSTRLVAVDQTGKPRADLRIPVPLTVFEIGQDYVLGRYRDANEESHIALYRLRR